MRRSIWALVVLTALAPLTTAADTILTNGSFEDGPPLGGFQDIDVLAGSTAITGWTVTGDGIDYLGPPWDVSEGQHAVDLDDLCSPLRRI